jgi:hypothetical protein
VNAVILKPVDGTLRLSNHPDNQNFILTQMKYEYAVNMLIEEPFRRGLKADWAAKILWAKYAKRYQYYSDLEAKVIVEPTDATLGSVSFVSLM